MIETTPVVRPNWRAHVSDYVALTKPRIMSLLLVTAIAGAVLGAGGMPGVLVFASVLVGGAMASGGASALNMWFEEDLDRRMGRTKARPVATGRVSPRNALAFGLLMNLGAFLVLAFGANVLAASLAILGTVLYFGLYTAWLKRSTVHNIVIGGSAGAVPPLVGYAAATGTLDLSAWYLFAIIFFWTPPHFWALALMIKDDYARAKVPMLPVVQGEETTRLQILLYSILLSGLVIAFAVSTSRLGIIYVSGAAALSAWFIVEAVRLVRRKNKVAAWSTYRYSLLYLFLLFGLIMADASIS